MVLRQHLHHARRRQGIGVDRIDHTNAAHVYHRVTAKFRVIHHQHHVARIFDNRALGAYLMLVKFQQRAVAINTANTENAEIETELGDKVLRRFANNAAVAATEFTAGEDNTKILFRH